MPARLPACLHFSVSMSLSASGLGRAMVAMPRCAAVLQVVIPLAQFRAINELGLELRELKRAVAGPKATGGRRWAQMCVAVPL